jgi:hypothetical protein
MAQDIGGILGPLGCVKRRSDLAVAAASVQVQA